MSEETNPIHDAVELALALQDYALQDERGTGLARYAELLSAYGLDSRQETLVLALAKLAAYGDREYLLELARGGDGDRRGRPLRPSLNNGHRAARRTWNSLPRRSPHER